MVTGLLPALCAAQLPALPLTGLSTAGTGLTPFYMLGFELGPWQDYLARELTPDYMQDPSALPMHISWMDHDSVLILPTFARSLVEPPRTWSQVDLDWEFMDTYGHGQFDAALSSPGLGFERQLLSTGLFHQLENDSLLGVEAVLAYQSYGTAKLGTRSYTGPVAGYGDFAAYQPYQESGYGTGVRLNLRTEVVPGLAFDAGFQSRIDMEEFAFYRGVYSNPADFDIPARAMVNMALQANERSWLNLSIERVLYSDVSAFAGRYLPDRFLSMLGDSTSPVFSWNDLTVYTLGWTWSNGRDLQWHVDLSSRSTPSPTSSALQRALSADVADHAMLVGVSRLTGERSRFNLNAAYAPADFAFGGNVLGVTADSLDQELELEASWTVDF
jgi:long-chain fatty acid transport protein